VVTYAEIVDAARRLTGVANRTPVATSRTLDRRLGATLFLKCESFQRGGAFKFRGAYNAIARVNDAERRRGIIAYSSGNHGQAVALASRLVLAPATIVMPTTAPLVKRRAVEDYGARVVPYDPRVQQRETVAEDLRREGGLTLVPPFDHPDVVAGQGTAAKELLDDIPDLDLLLVPCGGGGLLSGSAIVVRNLCPSCKVIGVEPELADDATRSFRTGALHTVTNPPTIADGARTSSLGTLTFPLVRQYVDDMVTVSEEDIVASMRFLWERMKLVVEPTGALALAAAYRKRIAVGGQRVGVILSGGNVDLGAALELFQGLGD
jgi:threo-3-hydroxy-L-aspartate ammonia-lyase